MYFKDFPKFLYDFKYDNTDQTQMSVVRDITRNVRFRKEILENYTLYDEYDIKDGETPEIIAEKIYGNPEYHWIIMLVNQRYDYITDFPLEYPALIANSEQKYGSGNLYDTHHYENADGFIVDSEQEGAVSVSNIEYEERINEAKRRIKIISPDVVTQILKQYKELM